VRLDAPLPAEVTVGEGTALFVCGRAFDAGARVRRLQFVVDGSPQPVMAAGMPRLDPFGELALQTDNGYRSGFWGIVRIPATAGDHDQCVLDLAAEVEDGRRTEAPLSRIALTPAPEPPRLPGRLADRPVASADEPLIAICMATHNPPPDLLARQLESIRAQTHSNWICMISDDCSAAAPFEAMRGAVGEDHRFVLDRSPRRLGFYANFERALSMVPPEADYVALADQDDSWYPHKLSRLLAGVGDAQLIYSDARIVGRDGGVIAGSYWGSRRNNHSDMLSLLVANSVTGAASLLRAEVLRHALPFPPGQFAHYHDHWLALTALGLGEIRFVEEPLYDYVQHGGASLGHARANAMPALRDRVAGLATRSPRDRVRKWRMHYFVDVARLMQVAAILLMRLDGRLAPEKRRALDLMLGADSSIRAPLLLAGRGLRELFGRPETLGAEWMLFGALVWRRLLGASARDRPQRHLRLDAVPPPDLAPGPPRATVAGPAITAIDDKIAPLPFRVSDRTPRRVNLLVPTVDLQHLFAGYIGKFNLARRLAERGHRVRIVTVDPTSHLPRGWAAQLERYDGLAGLTRRVEVEFGREAVTLEMSPADAFIATTWWTAHIAHAALGEQGSERFLYLIQEYEPFTFPMGTYAALAAETYSLPHCALFSSELLRGFFRNERLGVYANSVTQGEAGSVAFQNAITAVTPPSPAQLAGRRPRRLLFYARPEPHAARNMFELGVLALERALADGAFARDWELHGIGTVQGEAATLRLGGGATLELLPRLDQRRYADMLAEHDLGLALMYTPHPSMVPIEMAAAGMLAVTNTFANKTPEALAEISSNVLAAAPTIEGVARALREGAEQADDAERRIRGSQVHWSRDWETSFSDALLERIEGWLGL
jgi:glycosyltransferase involved in cell wall biosynthesis